jgi:hypothetical protein
LPSTGVKADKTAKTANVFFARGQTGAGAGAGSGLGGRARRPSKKANGEQEGQGRGARLPSAGVKKAKKTKKTKTAKQDSHVEQDSQRRGARLLSTGVKIAKIAKTPCKMPRAWGSGGQYRRQGAKMPRRHAKPIQSAICQRPSSCSWWGTTAANGLQAPAAGHRPSSV